MTKSAEPNLMMQKHQKLLPIPHIASIEFAFDDFALSDWVQQILSLGLKHTVRDKINETLFLADIDGSQKTTSPKLQFFYNNVCDCEENQKITNNTYTCNSFDKFSR